MNQITGTFPLALCEIGFCQASAGNPDLVAPCGSTDCCKLDDRAASLPVCAAEARAELAEARAELAEKKLAEAELAEAPCGETSDPGLSGPIDTSEIDTSDERVPCNENVDCKEGLEGTMVCVMEDPEAKLTDYVGFCHDPYDTDSCRCDGNSASLSIIIPVVIAAVLLVAAVLYLVRKRRVAARQPHRQSSMPAIGGDDEAEVEA